MMSHILVFAAWKRHRPVTQSPESLDALNNLWPGSLEEEENDDNDLSILILHSTR